MYAKGQSPTDTVKRVDSFTLDDSLTIYESEKLNEINQRVSLFNDENQFDDTNLVAKTINGLMEKQLEPNGTKNYFASASFDNTIKIWNINFLNCEQTLEGHSSNVVNIIKLKGSTNLASCSTDNTIKIWKKDNL